MALGLVFSLALETLSLLRVCPLRPSLPGHRQPRRPQETAAGTCSIAPGPGPKEADQGILT